MSTLKASPKKPFNLRIVIDNQDADDCPETPLTLNVYADDVDGTPSRIGWDIGSENCLIGSSIPAMLRELASKVEGGAVTK